MRGERESQKARADAHFKMPEARVADTSPAKAERNAEVAARDANTDRLKGLREARDEADRVIAAQVSKDR